YHCECTKKYFSNLLQKLDITALETIIKEDKKAEIICQYCKKVYNFTEKELTEIVTKKQP
ncbi:MAG: Hsp33 family molecular chaperone HslO, partial [Acholeplasmatales bacterium]